MAYSYGFPVQVATIDTADQSSVANINVKEIEKVIKKNRIDDIPVVIIAIAGLARKGKSFFLNLLIAYLKHFSQNPLAEFSASSSVISGMNWAGGRIGVTKGIWLWDEAFIIMRRDNSKVAILLMDTQGIFDGNASAQSQVDSQIIYMTLSMATIYIHNVDNNWTSPERKIYQICKSFSEIYARTNQNGEALFNSFTLLYRNWTGDMDFGMRPEVYQQEIANAKNDGEAEKIVNGIDRLFRYKTAWTLPEPSDSVRKCRESGSLKLTDVGKEFLDSFVKVAKELVSPNGHYSEQMDCAVTGRMLLERIRDLSDSIECWPEMKTDDEQLKQLYVRKAYISAKEKTDEESRLIENSDNIQDINEWHERAEALAIIHFKEKAINANPYDKFYRRYLDKLKNAIEKKKILYIHQAEVRVHEKQLKVLTDETDRLKRAFEKQKEISEEQKKEYDKKLEKIEVIKKKITKKNMAINILRGVASVAEAVGSSINHLPGPAGVIVRAVGTTAKGLLSISEAVINRESED